MKPITITETTSGDEPSTVRVVSVIENDSLCKLMHDGDGEDLTLTTMQYQLLHRAGELTITAGNIVTYYLQVREKEFTYGTSHLKAQKARLRDIIHDVDELGEGCYYNIVDTGLGEWNSGYRYLGYHRFNDQWFHQFKNTLDPHDLGEPDMYSELEIKEMISKKQIGI